jgi:hypothetical protein
LIWMNLFLAPLLTPLLELIPMQPKSFVDANVPGGIF